MDKLNDLLQELEISKVRLAKFLGVSRQMVYNYLDSENLEKMPNDKKLKLFNLLEIESLEDIKNIKGFTHTNNTLLIFLMYSKVNFRPTSHIIQDSIICRQLDFYIFNLDLT